VKVIRGQKPPEIVSSDHIYYNVNWRNVPEYFRGIFQDMTLKKRIAGPDDPQVPANPGWDDHHSSIQEPPRQPADLRTLIQNLKESEKQLNVRCSLLQAIIDGANTAIFSVDTGCCYMNFNKKHADDIQKLYGTVIRVGEELKDFISIEKDLQKIHNLIRVALAGKEGTVSDYFGDNARNRRYFDISCYTVRNDAGHITGAAVIATDTTLRKQSERTLTEQEERFRRFAEDAPDLLYRLSLPGGRYEYVSPASLSFTGYPPEEFYKKPGLLYDLVHPSGKDAFGRQQELLMKGKTQPAAEFQIVHRNGDLRWLFFRTTLIRDSTGHPVAAEGIVTDVTERKKEQIALEETNERFRTIVESADAGIVLVDAETHVIADANPRALGMIGAPRDEVIGSICHRFICPAETGKCPVTDLHERVEKSERLILTADGRSIPVLKTVVAAKISGRDLLIESFIDLSEQKKTEDALQRSEERYRAFITNSSEGIFRYAADCEIPVSLPADEQIALSIRHGYLAECNDAIARMYGYDRAEEMIGQKLETILDVTDTGLLEEMRKFIRNGYHLADFETEVRDRAGNTHWFSNTMNGVVQDGRVLNLWGVLKDITDRKNAEITIKESEEWYRELVEHSIDIIYTLSFSGEITSLSPAVLPLLGYQPYELVGKNIQDLFKPESRKSLQEEIDRKKNSVRSDTFYEVELRAKDGRFIPFEVNIRIRTEGRKNPDIIGIARGISERKKSEDALRVSEERFRALIQNSSDIIQILDPEKLLVYSSPAFSTVLGYPEGSQNRRNLLDLVYTDDRERIAADLEEVYTRTNPGTPTEYRMLTADGNFLYVESVGVNLLGVPGIDGIVINTHTVHERKLAEQALQESEERFRLIFQHSNDAIYLFEITSSGMPGKIVDANEVAIHQTGFAKDELVQKTLLELCSRDLSQHSRAIMMELLTRGEARFETDKIKKDGALLPVEISARLAKLKDKTYVIAISRDISRRKREERALRIANQKLQLMNIVAWHDIQNKVTGLRGYVELSKDLVTDGKLKKFMDSEEDVLRVIQRQLQYTKEYQEMGIHPPQWVNLPQVLRMIVSFKEIGSLKLRMDLHDLELYCDPVIEKVFTHLIENTERHGKKATEIHISCRETASGLLLIYEDDGVGIPLEKKKDLFVRGVGSATGFSLFFVHDILEISDMTIQENGEPQKGVRFEISVPRGLYRSAGKDRDSNL
jgi:PAS domain S-box-containing protein